MNRRSFLKFLATSTTAAAFGAAAYGFYEASAVVVEQPTVTLSRLPKSFDGFSIAFLTDILHGPYQDDEFLRSIVRTTNMLDPDLIVLGGNYALRDLGNVRSCFQLLKELRAPHGTFGVLGAYDHRLGADAVRTAMQHAKIIDLTDGGAWIERGTDRFRLSSLADPSSESVLRLVVNHDPRIAESVRDPRVGLLVCGSDRATQLNLPVLGTPWVGPYQPGLVTRGETKLYISRGLGVAGVPVRYGSHPEITLLTLRCSTI